MDHAEEIDLFRLLLMFYANKYKIIITTLLFALLALLFTSFIKPTYVASVLIQLEKNPQNNFISKLMSPLEGGAVSPATEMGILKSRRVLSQTIDELGLQLDVREKRFPIVGELFARFVSEPFPGVFVTKFSVPLENEDIAWELTVLSSDSYQLNIGESGVLKGKINQTLNKNGFVINVAQINAPAGTSFTVTSRSKFAVIQDLLKQLTATELNKDSGLLSVSFSGQDKKEIVRVLDNISQNFIEDNRLRKAEEASKTLEFVNGQLPGILDRLNQADRQLHLFKAENGSVDLPLEAKAVLDASVAIQAQQNELQLAKVEVSKLYTKSHPVYRSLLEKEALLKKEKAALLQTIAAMPKKQQAFLSIKRDVKSGHEIYMQLLSKQHELGIAKAGTVASIRIVDEAVSDPKPVGSKKSLIVILAAMLGFMFSCGYCLILQVFRVPLEDTETIETHGLEVLASIPLSKCIQRKRRQNLKLKSAGKRVWLARQYPEDLAIEALRSLRTGIFIALRQANKNSFLVSSATPGAGKTFISGNLASVMADAGKSVLLIDADLRLGYLHELLGLREAGGLSDILQGQSTFIEHIQNTTCTGLDFISRGAASALSSEVLMSERLGLLLQWAQQKYDYVIVDTPPILPITDAAIVAQHVGLSLLTLRYKTNNVRELKMSINRFKKCGIELDGVVFNGVKKGSPSAYEYAYYSTPQ
ncbi:polysaccharide biosynthesis tyrosine autokinase [Dryocola boscaweniae]|nr:polysaccharide biosynthesis tyrosine autokinase [Dryocola boscaweniae]